MIAGIENTCYYLYEIDYMNNGGNMDRKLIFLDIDGTLTEGGRDMPPLSAQRAVKEAREKGHLVYICTGRNYAMLRPLLAYGFDGFVGSAGGYIMCRDQVVYDCPMTREQQDKTLKLLRKNGIFCTMEGRYGSYTDEGFKEFLAEKGKEDGNSELLRWREHLEESLDVRPMEEYDGEPIYKIVFMCERGDQLAEPREALEEEFQFCIQDEDDRGVINGELINRKFDKGRGVERVCRHLGIDVEDTIAFGDSMNDVEMIETAGVGVCMENGSATLKKLADEICPAVTADGLQKTFDKYGLI